MFFMFLKKKQFLGKPLEQINSKPLLAPPACVEFALLVPMSFIFFRGLCLPLSPPQAHQNSPAPASRRVEQTSIVSGVSPISFGEPGPLTWLTGKNLS